MKFCNLHNSLRQVLLLFFTKVQLICSVLLISAVQQSDLIINIYYAYYFSYSFPLQPGSPTLQTDTLPSEPRGKSLFHQVYYRISNSRTLLFIHPIHDNLYLLIPNSQSFPSTYSSPLATVSLLSRSMSLFLSHRHVHLCHILDSIYK